jgi:hypothetical protein
MERSRPGHVLQQFERHDRHWRELRNLCPIIGNYRTFLFTVKSGGFSEFSLSKAPAHILGMSLSENKRQIKRLTPGDGVAKIPPIPRWARLENTAGGGGEVAFGAGAVVAQLHARVMALAPFAGAWRQRLALKAAEASAGASGRAVNEQSLRDAFYLRQATESRSPAGRLLEAWRALDFSAPLADAAIEHVVDILGVKMDDGLKKTVIHARMRRRATVPRHSPQLRAHASRTGNVRGPSCWPIGWPMPCCGPARLAVAVAAAGGGGRPPIVAGRRPPTSS